MSNTGELVMQICGWVTFLSLVGVLIAYLRWDVLRTDKLNNRAEFYKFVDEERKKTKENNNETSS